MKIQKIPTSFIYPDLKPEDYRFGSGQVIGAPLREDGEENVII